MYSFLHSFPSAIVCLGPLDRTGRRWTSSQHLRNPLSYLELTSKFLSPTRLRTSKGHSHIRNQNTLILLLMLPLRTGNKPLYHKGINFLTFPRVVDGLAHSFLRESSKTVDVKYFVNQPSVRCIITRVATVGTFQIDCAKILHIHYFFKSSHQPFEELLYYDPPFKVRKWVSEMLGDLPNVLRLISDRNMILTQLYLMWSPLS